MDQMFINSEMSYRPVSDGSDVSLLQQTNKPTSLNLVIFYKRKNTKKIQTMYAKGNTHLTCFP